MHWALAAACLVAVQASLTHGAVDCSSFPNTLTGTAGHLVTESSKFAIPVSRRDGAQTGMDVECFTFTHERCGVDATSLVTGVSLVLFDGDTKLLDGAGVPLHAMNSGALLLARINVKATHYALEFRVDQAAGAVTACTGTPTFTYQMRAYTDEIPLGAGAAGTLFHPLLVEMSSEVLEVGDSYSFTFLKGVDGAPKGHIDPSDSCASSSGPTLTVVPGNYSQQDRVTMSGTLEQTGNLYACVSKDATTETSAARFFVLGGNDVVSTLACGGSKCTGKVLEWAQPGSQVRLAPGYYDCSQLRHTLDGTLTDLAPGAPQEVDFTVSPWDISFTPTLCFKNGADGEWIKTYSSQLLNSAIVERAEELAQTAPAHQPVDALAHAGLPKCATQPEVEVTGRAGQFTTDSPKFLLPTYDGVRTGFWVGCFNFVHKRCGVDATSHVTDVSLVLFDGDTKLLDGAVGLMQMRSLQRVRINVKATHFALEFRVDQAAGAVKPCFGDPSFTFSLGYASDALPLGTSSAGTVFIPLLVEAPDVLEVGEDFSMTFFKATVDAPSGYLSASPFACVPSSGSQLQVVADPSDLNRVVLTGRPTEGGYLMACMQSNTSGTDLMAAEFFVVGGTHGVVSERECANSKCKVTVIERTLPGSQVMLVPDGADCTPLNAHPGTLTDLPPGPAQELELSVPANAGNPDVCFKRDANTGFIKTADKSEVGPAVFQRALEIAESDDASSE